MGKTPLADTFGSSHQDFRGVSQARTMIMSDGKKVSVTRVENSNPNNTMAPTPR